MDNRLEALRGELAEMRALELQIDMTRGNPSLEQEALSWDMLNCKETRIGDIDCANYGGSSRIYNITVGRNLIQ